MSMCLYYNLLLLQTGACGPRKGLPPVLLNTNLKNKGEKKVFTMTIKWRQ